MVSGPFVLSVATAQEQRQQNGADNRDDDRPETAAPGREERKHECDNRRLALHTRVARFRPEIAIDEFARESDCGQSKDPAKHDAKRSSENPPRDVCASSSFQFSAFSFASDVSVSEIPRLPRMDVSARDRPKVPPPCDFSSQEPRTG